MKIVVLMSTYNGEKYIKEQLNSILAQTYPTHVLIRDDGSKDETVNIIEDYIAAGADINLIKGQNLGVKGSFFELIKLAPEADYYSFADQDDVWLDDKLEAAVTMLQAEENTLGYNVPLLYCSNANLVDADLNLITRENKKPRPSFGNALVENICTGCTAVINRALIEKIRENIPDPDKIIMHDWWLYLIAEAFGKTVFDDEPHINYRQHGNNEWGVKTSRWAVAKHRIKQLFAKRGQIYGQVGEFMVCMKEDNTIKEDYKKKIQEVLDAEKSFVKRMRLIRRLDIYRNDKSRDLVYRCALILNKM